MEYICNAIPIISEDNEEKDYTVMEAIFDHKCELNSDAVIVQKYNYMMEMIKNNEEDTFNHFFPKIQFSEDRYNELLRKACNYGNLEIVKTLMKSDKANIEYNNYTCIDKIIKYEHEDIMDYLLDQKYVDINRIFVIAIMKGNTTPNMLDYCSQKGINFNIKYKFSLAHGEMYYPLELLLNVFPFYNSKYFDSLLYLLDETDPCNISESHINKLFSLKSILITDKLIELGYVFPDDITWLNNVTKNIINKNNIIPTLLCVVSDTKLNVVFPGLQTYHKDKKYYYGYPASGKIDADYLAKIEVLRSIGSGIPEVIEFK